MSEAVRRRTGRTPRAVVAWAVAGLVALATGAAVLTAGVAPDTAGVWLLPAAVVVAWEWWFLTGNVDANHPTDAPDARRDGLGLANGVTLGRGLLYAGVAGFLLTGSLNGAWAWAPALLYGAGAALDAVDGAIARHVGSQTVLGERLDMGVDTLGFLVAPLVGVAWGRIPVWYLALSAARYLFKFGRWQRQRRGLAVYDLPDSRVRRPLAGLQMAFIAVALAPVLPVAIVEYLAAVVVTPSLLVFARDYLAVAGHVGGSDGGDEEDNGEDDEAVERVDAAGDD
ncbi:CDP-alcohol phosphatidyltransferase family protein [Halobaculum limi]|uniref:CDP-alcohol phosphatidyltransferase family protein n=1 Tax=Halobaculum limi TaxID=3031916 RepID=UPI0024060DD6|nr:CDP-alcohol phosphatidyltransferase family protein [Halobaculum sp. YSMS11]